MEVFGDIYGKDRQQEWHQDPQEGSTSSGLAQLVCQMVGANNILLTKISLCKLQMPDLWFMPPPPPIRQGPFDDVSGGQRGLMPLASPCLGHAGEVRPTAAGSSAPPPPDHDQEH